VILIHHLSLYICLSFPLLSISFIYNKPYMIAFAPFSFFVQIDFIGLILIFLQPMVDGTSRNFQDCRAENHHLLSLLHLSTHEQICDPVKAFLLHKFLLMWFQLHLIPLCLMSLISSSSSHSFLGEMLSSFLVTIIQNAFLLEQ
jgi:hypothetical protein